MHEVLIRVMADLSVPLGTVYADLGVNTRRIAATILCEGVEAHLSQIAELLASIRARAQDVLDGELAALFDDPAPISTREKKIAFGLPFFGRRPAPQPVDDREARAQRRLDDPAGEPDSLERCARESLRTVVASVIARQGFLIRDRGLLRRLAAILVSNAHGSRRIGATIEPWIAEVVMQEGYRRVGAQDRPVVMNVKGASASGKSTIRPYQRALVERSGADWSDFAVITPDVWRKFLLDYDSLGPARRYAGPLTGHEVEILDATWRARRPRGGSRTC